MNLNPKTSTAGIAGVLATILLGVAQHFDIANFGPEEAAAVVTLIMFVAAYFKSQGDWTPKS